MKVIPLSPGDQIVLKKPHPCGNHTFRVVRVGADVRVICETCGRDLTMERVRLEKAIRKVVPGKVPEQTLPDEQRRDSD